MSDTPDFRTVIARALSRPDGPRIVSIHFEYRGTFACEMLRAGDTPEQNRKVWVRSRISIDDAALGAEAAWWGIRR